MTIFCFKLENLMLDIIIRNKKLIYIFSSLTENSELWLTWKLVCKTLVIIHKHDHLGSLLLYSSYLK
jgi:hypothetical protein